MKNYRKMSVAQDARIELHDSLVLAGAEVSIGCSPAGTGVPFVHSREQNEEICGILSGKGFITTDGEKIELQAGDWLHIAPDGERQIFTVSNSPISFIYIQAEAGSLEGYTVTDGVI